MKEDNIIRSKTYRFALKVVPFCYDIQSRKKEFILTKQLVRSGSLIGANIEEAIGGQSPKDFFAKLTISYKEARESHYWIKLLRDTGFAEKKWADELMGDCEEILRIIGAIQKTIRTKNQTA